MIQGGDPTGMGRGGTSIVCLPHSPFLRFSESSFTIDTKPRTLTTAPLLLAVRTKYILNSGSPAQWPIRVQTPTVRVDPLRPLILIVSVPHLTRETPRFPILHHPFRRPSSTTSTPYLDVPARACVSYNGWALSLWTLGIGTSVGVRCHDGRRTTCIVIG